MKPNSPSIHSYTHKQYPSDKIEFVGMRGDSNFMFRYPRESHVEDTQSDNIFFSLSRENVEKYYERA